MNNVSNNKQSLTNDAEGMGATKRLFVDLWANETTIQRKRIVVEVPSDTEDGEVESIGGTALIIIADEQQVDANWEIEDSDGLEVLDEIHVDEGVPEHLEADLVLVRNHDGRLMVVEERREVAT